MGANDESSNSPAGESPDDENEDVLDEQQDQDDQDGDNEEEGGDKDNTGHERIWDSPVGTGDVIPFDPTKFKPAMTKEEIEKLLEKNKP